MNIPHFHDGAAERRLRALLEATGQIHLRLNDDLSILESLDGGGLVADAQHPLADWIARYIPHEDRGRLRQAAARALAERHPLHLEHRIRRLGGGLAWVRLRLVPVLDGEGRIEEWLGAAEDVTAQVEARERLTIAIDIAGLSTWDWDVASGRVAWNEGHFHLYGYTPGEVTPSYESWSARVHPEDFPTVEARLLQARDEGVPYEAEFRIRPGPGEVRWCRAQGRFHHDAEGRPIRMVGVMQDITPLKEAEARQRSLMAEFQRQVRNSLSVIRSIVRRSAQTAKGKDAFATHLEGRIGAITRAQAMMMRAMGAGIDLEEILRDEMRAAALTEDCVRLSGPPMRLPGRAAEMMALAVHELTTNALKFGALASPGGCVAVDWNLVPGEPPWLRLRWSETGGRPVRAPRRKGFGSELIDRMLPYSLRARTRVEHRAEGFCCEIELPLDPGDG